MSRPVRYTFIVGLVSLGTALAAVGGWRYARASAPVSGPIVLISVDALRADHLPIYGYDKVRTPAIDALAADGVVFEHAYSHAPQTLPAHASLLSGRLPFETGVRDNAGFRVSGAERLLAEMLRDRGYETGAVVSSYVLRRETGIGQGFTFFDDDVSRDAPEEADAPLYRDGARSERLAEDWLTSSGTERAFLFLHLNEPHKPYTPPARFADYDPYDGEIAYVDEIVGRFVKYLKTHQLYDQSTIVFVADHGEGLGDHGEQEHGLFVYEEALRVPLVVKPAAGEGAGRRVTDVVQHIDIVPTILDLAKAPIPDNIGGLSLTPLLGGTGSLPRRTVYSESFYGRYRFGWSELTTITDGRYRYIRAPREELYDLTADPAQKQNLAQEGLPSQTLLRTALDRLIARPAMGTPAEVAPQDHEKLEALGYVGIPRARPGSAAEQLPDPKDRHGMLEAYRSAVDRAVAHQWPDAIDLLRAILRDEPAMADIWMELASFAVNAGRFDQAVEGYKRALALQPDDAAAHLGAAAALLRLRKLEEARQHAALAADASEDDRRSRAAAQELLARIALARRDAATARRHAELARQEEPALPMPAYVDGRLLYDQTRYADALPLFEQAIDEIEALGGRQIPDLRFHAADALFRLERYAEAERQFLAELTGFPHDVRARAGLAILYHATGRADAAARTLTGMVQRTPTPEAYNLAARGWTTLGNSRQAAAVRAEAARRFAPSRQSVASAGR